MKKISPLLITLFIFSNCTTQKHFQTSIKGTVDFIQKDGDSVEVFVKHKRLYNNSGYDIFVARFSIFGFPDSVKIGKSLTLYRANEKNDTCDYVFRPVK